MGAGSVHVGSLLELAVFVYALFYENLFKRGKVELFLQFVPAYLEFASQQPHGMVYRIAQHVAHRKELRLVVLYDAAVRRYVYLAVRECVKSVKCLV